MRLITLISTTGGAGRTTLCALLGQTLARAGHDVLLLDLDPANVLGLALGAGGRPATGLVSHGETGRWAETALRTAEGIHYLPFGAGSPDAVQRLAGRLVADPLWLHRELQRIDFPDDGLVLCDTPRQPSPFTAAAIAGADLLLDVLATDVYAYATLPAGGAADRARRSVLNGYDARRHLHGDLRLLLVERLGATLCPFPIHRDEALAEALARDRALADDAPDSQIMRDIDALGRWLLDALR